MYSMALVRDCAKGKIIDCAGSCHEAAIGSHYSGRQSSAKPGACPGGTRGQSNRAQSQQDTLCEERLIRTSEKSGLHGP